MAGRIRRFDDARRDKRVHNVDRIHESHQVARLSQTEESRICQSGTECISLAWRGKEADLRLLEIAP